METTTILQLLKEASPAMEWEHDGGNGFRAEKGKSVFTATIIDGTLRLFESRLTKLGAGLVKSALIRLHEPTSLDQVKRFLGA